MRIVLFFTRGYGLETWAQSGIFEREVALYRQLQTQGIHISFVTYGKADDRSFADVLPGITILCNRFNLAPKRYERWLPFLHGLHLRTADVFKTNQMSGAQIALRAANLWKKPLVVRMGYLLSDFMAQQNGKDAEETQQVYQMETKVLTAANQIVVTTDAMQQTILQRVPAVVGKVRVLPNFVDTDQFIPQQSPKRWDIIFVGRLHRQKNIEALLQAVQATQSTLCIIGSGELEDDLKRKYDDLDGRITWQGRIPHYSIPQYLHQAKVYILPSLYEGHPKTLIEAMACGMPVIGTNVLGIREILQHGENALVCNIDADSIRNTLELLLSDSALRAQLGQKARLYALEHYSLHQIAVQEAQLLKAVARGYS
jgi:glycosyltransferase involved in cell wall biosynthesis